MQKKFISVLLTLLMMAGVIAVAPVMASAVTVWEVNDATELAYAIGDAQNGDTIKLMGNITADYFIGISGMTITFDLNGKTLNLTDGLELVNAELKLADPANGELNVSLDDEDNYALSVVNGKAEVTSVSASGFEMGAAVYASESEIVIHGNVRNDCTFTPGALCYGVKSTSNSNITIEGTITCAAGVGYIDVEGTGKTQTQYTTPTTKTGYLTYTDGTDTVWVKCNDHAFGVTWLKDATNHWRAVCSKCDAADTPAAHTPGDWATVLEPTTTTPGSKQKTCTVCQAVTATEAIAVLKAVGLFGMNTTYPSNIGNWLLFFLCFGFIWMWFVK